MKIGVTLRKYVSYDNFNLLCGNYLYVNGTSGPSFDDSMKPSEPTRASLDSEFRYTINTDFFVMYGLYVYIYCDTLCTFEFDNHLSLILQGAIIVFLGCRRITIPSDHSFDFFNRY